jgi:hypothetical protein
MLEVSAVVERAKDRSNHCSDLCIWSGILDSVTLDSTNVGGSLDMSIGVSCCGRAVL